MRRNLAASLVTWKNGANRQPLILRGARQVGKTYLLKAFGASEFPVFHYINFEENTRFEAAFSADLSPRKILNEIQFLTGRKIDPATDLLILDEIQQSPRALTSLKYFCEEMPELAVCAAGSLLGLVLAQTSFPVGKVAFLDLNPLTFEEFIGATKPEPIATALIEQKSDQPFPLSLHKVLWDSWKEYLVVGGMPACVDLFRQADRGSLFAAMGAIREKQRTLLDGYMADIAKHSGKANALHVSRLWQNVPSQLARTLDGSADKFVFKDAVPGLRGHERLAAPIAWLEQASLLLRVSIIDKPSIPFSAYAQENRFKLFFHDVGLLGAMAGIPPEVFMQYGFGSYQGYIAENFVAQEFRTAGLAPLYCWEGRTSEIEFVVAAGTTPVPIEVKSGSVTKSKSLSVFEAQYHPSRSFILSAKPGAMIGTRHHLPIYAAGRLAKELRHL